MNEWRWLMGGVGFVVGAACGGTLGWSLGLYAWRMGEVGLFEGTLFVLSFLLLLVGLIGPLVLVRYFADRSTRLHGESGTTVGGLSLGITKGRQIGNFVGYVAIPVFYVALAGIGIYLSGDGTAFDPFEMVAVFDAVGGGVLGGIGGVILVSRHFEAHRDRS